MKMKFRPTLNAFLNGLILSIALLFALKSASAKDIFVAQGQKTLIAFWRCTDAVWCHLDMCIDIKKVDGSSGRARLFSDWEPGKYRDLDVHEGQYCDKLDAYVFMAYWLYAVPETDVMVRVGNEIAP
jgi:hypothetical protein